MPVCNVASDWARTVKVFLFSMLITINKVDDKGLSMAIEKAIEALKNFCGREMLSYHYQRGMVNPLGKLAAIICCRETQRAWIITDVCVS